MSELDVHEEKGGKAETELQGRGVGVRHGNTEALVSVGFDGQLVCVCEQMERTAIADTIHELSALLLSQGSPPHRPNPKKLVSFLTRIHHLLLRLHDHSAPSLLDSPLQGLLHDLLRLRHSADSYLSKSDLYQIVHSPDFNHSLTLISRSIATWLASISLSVQDNLDLFRELSELSSELELTHLKETHAEHQICGTIDQELRNGSHRPRNHGLIAHLARELGIGHDSPDYVSQFSSRIELYKNDDRESPRDRQIAQLLMDLLENSTYSSESEDPTIESSDEIDAVIIEEEQPCPPFQSFICPLSREVMVEPVVLLETQQTYDRAGIEYWFTRRAEEGQPPTCPATGKTLTSTEWTRNRTLQNTIAEWLDRNFETRITTAKTKLASIVKYEEGVEDVKKIAEESSKHRSGLGRAGIIPLLVEPWKRSVMNEYELRSKVLVALRSMAMDNKENKLQMVNEDVVRYAVKSLTSGADREKECAAELLHELSSEPEICAKIGSQKGAIVLLDGMTENEKVVRLAKQILANLEKEPSNVVAMADAGRLEPLLDLLNNGLPDVKLKMVEHLSRLTLSNNDKETVTVRAGKVLIDMLSDGMAEKSVAIRTLLMLSDLVDNGIFLVDNGILQPLFTFINSKDYKSHIPVVEDAVKVFANVIARPGHWEEAAVTANGDTMQSEYVLHCILGLMTRIGFKWKHSMLRLLYYVVSSPQISDAAITHIETGNGIGILSLIVLETETETSKLALKILAVLSMTMGAEVAEKLEEKSLYGHLMNLLKGSDLEEQGAAACILAETPQNEKDFLDMFGLQAIPWIIEQLNHSSRDSRHAKQNADSYRKEGLLRLLLRYCMASDSGVHRTLKEHNIMNVLTTFLNYSGYSPLRKMAAEGLRILSEKTIEPADMNPPTSWICCFALLDQKKTLPKASCRVHGDTCQTSRSYCIIQTDAVRPLVETLEDHEESVQLASIRALSTLLQDESSLRATLEELATVNGISSIIKLFCSVKPGELQDQLVFVIERITHVNDICQKYAIDQILTKTLVQAYKTAGSQATKTFARTALTNLKQISGMVASRK